MTAYRVAEDVAWVSRDDLDDGDEPMAYAVLLPHGRPVTMEGSACLVWLAVAEGGTLDDIAAAAAEMAGVEASAIIEDVRSLVESLVGSGLVRAG